MGCTNSIEDFLVYTAGKPHPFWHELEEAMGSHPDEVWVIVWEFIASFLITLEVDTCFIHPLPLDPSLSQRVCTEMLAVIGFWRQWGVASSCSISYGIYFLHIFQLQPIIATGACEVWVLIYLTAVILLMTLPLSAVTDTLTLKGGGIASSGLDSPKSSPFVYAHAFSCFKGIMQCTVYSIIMLLFLCLFLICRSVILSI